MADGDVKDLIKQVSSQLVETSDKLTKQAESAMAEVKNYGKLTEETKGVVDQLATKQTELQGVLDGLKTQVGDIEQKAVRRPGGDAPLQSIGRQFVGHESLKGVNSSMIRPGQRLSVPVKNALMSADIVDGVVEPMKLPGIDKAPKQRLFIRDLLAVGRTTSPSISWVQQTGFVNNARVVTEGATKPTSDISYAPKLTPVATIAHLFKAAKQILDDFTQLQSDVDTELRYGLKYAEEREILFGDGEDFHLHGIVPQAEAFDPAFSVTHQSHIDDLRLAMLQSQLARLPASGFVLHFIDWAKIELTKDELGRYIIANPLGLAGPTLWGLPVVATEVPEFEGEFLTGPFNSGASIYDREDANVVISTENADDFERNMITIRCEERLGLAVKRPEGFITGPFSNS